MSLRDWWNAVKDIWGSKPKPEKPQPWQPRHTWGPQEGRPEGPPPKKKDDADQ